MEQGNFCTSPAAYPTPFCVNFVADSWQAAQNSCFLKLCLRLRKREAANELIRPMS